MEERITRVSEQWREGRREGRNEGVKEGRKEGMKEERISSVKKIMEKLKLTAEEAMDVLEIPKQERSKYLGRL